VRSAASQHRPATRLRDRRRHEDGAGLISTSIGTLMLMLLLGSALHVLLALHTRTLVGAAAWDAARARAGKHGATDAEVQAQVDAMIGGLHPTTSFEGSNDDEVVVTVTATSPGFLPGVTSLDDLRSVKRTVHLRREKFR
jgi:Flp pilus assembly protein TadG